MTSPTTWHYRARLNRALRWVGSRETGLDSLFASKPVGPGFEPCLGQSAKLAGAPKPLCLLEQQWIVFMYGLATTQLQCTAHAYRLVSYLSKTTHPS